MLVQPMPAAVPREAWLGLLPDYVVHEYLVEEQTVDVDGDTAAVLSRVRMRADVLGEDRSGTFVLTDVWRRRSGGWRVWRRHSTPATAGRLPKSN
jgi:ketosteroid isomerase-like protein